MSKKALWQFNFHFWFIYVFLAALALTVTSQFLTRNTQLFGILFSLGQLLIVTAGLLTVFAILLFAHKLTSTTVDSNEKLENVFDAINKQTILLTQISHGVRLSEAAKTIVFRDMDRQSLREAAIEKLHQQDYDASYAIIENIGHRPGYENLALQLRAEADSYRSASQEEQINQAISHVEKLCDQYQWVKANTQAGRLMKAYPTHHRVQSLVNYIADRRQNRKKELLAAWDDAVKRQSTDESIELLRELDLYLSPSEGLALQDAARDVFRNKLHGLGVQFSMAVTEKRWDDALTIGQQIAADFPNTRMAQEIREKIDILHKKAGK